MSEYRSLAEKLANKEVVILDGAVGTQLQSLHVPMNSHAWAAEALVSHPTPCAACTRTTSRPAAT